MNDPNECGSQEPSLYLRTESSRAETAAFGLLGLAGLVSVIVAFGSAFAPAVPWGGSLAQGQRSGSAKHVRGNRVSADLRTAKAMMYYLLEPEPGLVTNLSAAGATQESAALPTNAAIIKPRA